MKYEPKKHLGQNFLVNKGIISKIIKSTRLSADDIVLEIGPGPGALTLELARACKKVVAVEKDRELAALLKERLKEQNIENVEIVADDIIKFLDSEDAGFRFQVSGFKTVANIPYYLTSALIRKLLESPRPPENIFLTIQKEVAQRICASDGKESLLSLSVKFYANPKIHFYISRGSFAPAPRVDSAFIEITPRKSPPPIAPERFFAALKAGFAAPRKKLASNLAENLPNTSKEAVLTVFDHLKISPDSRPEHLSLQQWLSLSQCLEPRPLNIVHSANSKTA